MTFYLAGPYSDREHLRTCASVIAGVSGWTCNARWLDGSHDGMSPMQAAKEDVADVRAADALVLVAERQSTKGGMWVELGIAIERPIPIVVVHPLGRDPRELNVFASYPTVFLVTLAGEAGDVLIVIERAS